MADPSISAAGVQAPLEREEFARDLVWPLVADGRKFTGVGFERHRHGIVELRFEGGPRVFAKPLADVAEAHGMYELLRAFREGGFGSGPHRVVEPIAVLEAYATVLIGAAPGRPLRDLRRELWPVWEDALRKAARWLAALHSSPLRIGVLDDSTRRVLHLARRIATTAAKRPELERQLVDLLARLGELAPDRPPQLAQTHGRYHDEHVYVDDEGATVIDVDRASTGEPAKDVAEFLHRLRVDPRRSRLDSEAADQASAVFVDEYRRHAELDSRALAFYWSYSVLFTLVARAGRAVGDDAGRDETALYEAEFAAIPSRASAYAG